MNQISDQPLILIADDDPEFREQLIPEALGRLNSQIRKARDVEEACLVAAQQDSKGEPLDLIVLDMHMPLHKKTKDIADDGGIQFLRGHHLTRCPVVVFTAYPSYYNCVRAVQAGAVAYLPKAEQEAYKGKEGGIDQLVETCRELLKAPQPTESRFPPDGDWLEQNYEWLCEEFGGLWVAFVSASRAASAGIGAPERAGLVVISEKSREGLVRLIAGKLALLAEIPPIAFIPETETGTNGVQEI
jgi:CheY-like chemotaxis protein